MFESQRHTIEDTSGVKLAASAAGLEAFTKAKLGITVHWGLYALIGRGEWVLNSQAL